MLHHRPRTIAIRSEDRSLEGASVSVHEVPVTFLMVRDTRKEETSRKIWGMRESGRGREDKVVAAENERN